jgi:hypothetical protein
LQVGDDELPLDWIVQLNIHLAAGGHLLRSTQEAIQTFGSPRSAKLPERRRVIVPAHARNRSPHDIAVTWTDSIAIDRMAAGALAFIEDLPRSYPIVRGGTTFGTACRNRHDEHRDGEADSYDPMA